MQCCQSVDCITSNRVRGNSHAFTLEMSEFFWATSIPSHWPEQLLLSLFSFSTLMAPSLLDIQYSHCVVPRQLLYLHSCLLPTIFNTVARIICLTYNSDPRPLLLKILRWLLIVFRITLKIPNIVSKVPCDSSCFYL
jgi:hypothetical protein